jgi:phage baseplate assembly protein W
MTGKRDLATLTGKENLEQALLMRFLTRAGELTVLGHSDYGSRLFQLIGELNNDANRNRAKLYVLQALEAESRVKEVVSVEVTPDPRVRTQINIVATLVAIDNNTPLTVAFPFLLGGN